MKIYRDNKICELPDGKANDFKTKDEAQKYLDGVLDKTIAMASRLMRNPQIETALRAGFEIR
jgi:hypothetical protein